jgi:hypothetical protein
MYLVDVDACNHGGNVGSLGAEIRGGGGGGGRCAAFSLHFFKLMMMVTTMKTPRIPPAMENTT